ncbi:MAG TPA: hypothetical protein VMZ71_00805 [Gemmataceae bacterium]|nr:hypothetical protein [Gemmataceae bacterium]
MNYTVSWLPNAEAQLAAVWLASPDRNSVSRASHEIDDFLAATPGLVGVVVFDTVYELTHHPLGVEYEVNDADRAVSVLAVWDSNLGRSNPTGN